MTKEWSEIFPGLTDPVRGLPSSYRTAEREAKKLRDATTLCADEFERVAGSNASGELDGQAADQLATLISEIDGSFQDLPPVFRTLTDIFDDHERKLIALRRSASEALARANTRWTALDTARSNQEQADQQLSVLDRQIRELEACAGDDPGLIGQLDDLRVGRPYTFGRASSCSTAVTNAERDLELSRTEHRNLVNDESDLIEETVDRIGSIDLGDLKDPNRLWEIVTGVASWAGNLVADVVVGVVQFVEAVASGDFMDALWRLSDLLGAVLTVLAVIGVALAIFTTGGLAIGLIVGVMATKLAVDVVLASTQHPHPDTGQPRTWGEVAVDATMLVVTVATAGVGGSASLGTRVFGANPGTQAAGRSMIGNVRNLVSPTSLRTGTRLTGAAATSSVGASQRQLGADVIDELVMPAIDATVGHGRDTLLASDGITTSADAWTDPRLVEFVDGSPLTTEGLRRIDVDVAAISTFSIVGPTARPTVPTFQLAEAA